MIKQKIGIVINNKSLKTILVQTKTIYNDLKYKKRLKKTRNYLVHDEENSASIGDIVFIKQIRPISRHKNWILTKILN